MNAVAENNKPPYARLNRKEWKNILATTESEFKKALGPVPTRASIRAMIDNPYATNFLQKLAMFLLMVLAVFTGFKVGALAVPFASNLMEHLTGSESVDTRVLFIFTGVSFLLFWFLSTPGLIYFKLLSHDERLNKQRENTANYQWYEKLSLEWLSPRLPSVMTYIIMAWLFAISIAGGGTVFEIFIPVLAELALAQLVGDILEQNASYESVISDRLKMEQVAYNTRLKNPEDGTRVALLSGIMIETMMNIQRNGQRPNAFLEKAGKEAIKYVLTTEYDRLTTADNFITEMNGRVLQGEELSTGELPVLEPEKTNLSGSKPATQVRTTAKVSKTRYTPPNGAKKWTHATLLHKLKVIGADPATYNEGTLSKDFAPNYNATGVWRKSVKQEFTGVKA